MIKVNLEETIAQFKVDTVASFNDDMWNQLKYWVQENIHEDDYSEMLEVLSEKITGELVWKD